MNTAMKTDVLMEVEPGEARTEQNSWRSPVFQYIATNDNAPPLLEATTLCELFEDSVKQSAHQFFQARRPVLPSSALDTFVYQTYREVQLVIRRKVDFYFKLELGKGSRIGVYGVNSPECLQTAIACDSISAVYVPIDVSLTVADVQFIIQETKLSCVSIQEEYFEAFVEIIEGMKPEDYVSLRGVDVWSSRLDFDGVDEKIASTLIRCGITVYKWNQSHGLIHVNERTLPKPDDECSIVYERSRGHLRGVVFTHRAVLAKVNSLLKWNARREGQSRQKPRRMLVASSLPAASALNRVIESMVMATNGAIGYWQGNGVSLCENLKFLAPTYLVVSQPSIECICGEVGKYVDGYGYLFRQLFDKSVEVKMKGSKKSGLARIMSVILDALVLRQIRKHFRFDLDTVLCFDKCLDSTLQDFVFSLVSTRLSRGYDIMEMNGLVSIGDTTSAKPPNWIGPVLPELEFKLFGSKPDSTSHMIGELCLRGPTLFSRYFMSNKAECQSGVDQEGFFNTGQKVEIDDDGSLCLLGYDTGVEKAA